jgi:hypothetical protein
MSSAMQLTVERTSFYRLGKELDNFLLNEF